MKTGTKFIVSPLLALFLLSANCLMIGLLIGSMTMINIGGVGVLVLSLAAHIVGPMQDHNDQWVGRRKHVSKFDENEPNWPEYVKVTHERHRNYYDK